MTTILNGIPLGCQSWCYRDFRGAEKLASLLKESDLGRLEICDVHCDFWNEDKWAPFVEEMEKLGIVLNSCGISGMNTDEARLRNLFNFAKRTGLTAIGADPDMDAVPLIEKLCNEYGIKIAIHNHGKHHRYGFEEQLDAIFAVSTPNVGLCLDTGWALDSGLDPVKLIHKYADRLYGVHLKDFTFDENGNPQETVLGTGVLDLSAVLQALRDVNFKGYASLEYEGDASDPAPKISGCVANLKKIDA